MALYEDLSVGKLTVTGGTTVGTLASVTGLSATHQEMGGFIRTTLTLVDVAQTVPAGATAAAFVGTKLFTFTNGRIQVHAAACTLQQKTTSVIASTINASMTCQYGLGTVTAAASTLATTMINILPGTGQTVPTVTSSATINVAGTAGSSALVVPSNFDGSGASRAVFLNSAYETDADVDAEGTQTWSGTIVIEWSNLGDF